MLKRIYVDNFRCLVNFELKFDRANLLLGENGTGKTAVFEVLYRLQQFMAGNAKVLVVFPNTDLTRWQTSCVQRFELDLEVQDCVYNYSLLIEHDEDRRKARIKSETLLLNGNKLFDFQEGQAQLYYDDFTSGPTYPFDWTQSGVGVLQPRLDNKKLTRFRQEMEKIIIVSIHPMRMSSESREDERTLSRNSENFVSWYSYLSRNQGALVELISELRKVLPGYDSFYRKEAGEATVLKVMFEPQGGKGKLLSYDFNELSDGQRVLIVLYSLLLGLKNEGVSLFLDEPDNFVTLREIQPWLIALTDSCGESVEQAVLISHHPEIIDRLALQSGRWFDRDNNGPTRVSDTPKAQVDGLTPSESMARGWQS